jgi:hypothetical protein
MLGFAGLMLYLFRSLPPANTGASRCKEVGIATHTQHDEPSMRWLR